MRASASFIVLLGSVALAGASACDGGRGGPGKSAEEAPEARTTPVRVAPLSRGEIEDRVTSASTIEAERSVTVHAEATGRVLELAFEEGDEVDAGAVLARVRRDVQASGVDRAVANRDKAARDLERVKALHARGAASSEELANAELAVRSAEIDVRDRRRDLSNTKVVAPFAGTITDRFVNTGAFVTSGQQLYGVTDFNTLVARVYVPERELDRIRVGQPAEVVGKAAAGRRATGKVDRIAPKVDATTGTVKVTVSLPPPEVAPDGGAAPASGFLPGMYAEVVLTTERHDDALLVPKSALVREEERVFVFLLDETGDAPVARRKLVEIGLANDEFVEAMSGLADEDRVIVAGHIGLKDGALVELVESTAMPEDGPEVAVAGATDEAQAEGT